MKKIIIGFILVLNVGITIPNHQIAVSAGSNVYAQRQGQIRQVGCTDPQYGGTDPTWWNIFTVWLQEIVGDAILWLGELYDQEIPGSGAYNSNYLYYPWGSGGILPYVDVYYDGYGASCYETPSIYAGPYRGGRMSYCTDGPSEYIDCAFTRHFNNASGISGRSDVIAYLDECNECVGGSTGLPPCSSPLYYLKLQNGDTTKYYDGDTITIERGEAWAPITLYNEHGVPPPSVHWYPTCNFFYNDWFGYDLGNTFNLNISKKGDYTIPVRTGIIWAQTPITTNHLRIITPDTIKPTPINCDSLYPQAVVRDSIATSMLNQIATGPQLKQTRDSALGNHEVSFSTYDSAGSTREYAGSLNIGPSGNVTIYPKDTVTGANHKNINSTWHLHHIGGDYFPDPADLFNLMLARTLRNATATYGVPSSNYNPHLNHSFIICDTSTDLAIVVYDTVLAYNFININHKDSVYYFDTSAAVSGPMYSKTYKGRRLLNGPISNISMQRDFDNAVNKLRNANYPELLRKTYAGIYMMQKYNMGIKTLMKVNGVFKELKIETTHNSNGTIRTIKVKICL